MLQEIPLPTEFPDSIESLVVIVFSTLAALISIFLERRKNKKDTDQNKTELVIHRDHDRFLLEKAFEELQKTIDILREENKALIDYNSKLGDVIDQYRNLYTNQVGENANLYYTSKDHMEEIEEIGNKLDYLLTIIHNKVCNDTHDLDNEE